MTRTPHHSKKKRSAVHGLPLSQAAVGGFFIIWYVHIGRYRDLAYKYGLWSAASIMCDGCSDDGFIDFRSWLIAQGREVYMAALKDPDSLADVPAYGGCCFESLSYVGDSVYEKLTGCSSYDTFDRDDYRTLVEELKEDIVYDEGIG